MGVTDADDLIILLAESEMELCEKTVKWRAVLEVKSMGMITGKTKVMFGHSTTDNVEEQGN